MVRLIVLAAIFSAATAASIVLTGDRSMLKGDLASPTGFLALIFNWKFILAMALAVCTRLLFVVINSTALSIPSLAGSATTVTTLITSLSYPVILGANALFLGERLSARQYLGAAFVIVGIVLATGQGRGTPRDVSTTGQDG